MIMQWKIGIAFALLSIAWACGWSMRGTREQLKAHREYQRGVEESHKKAADLEKEIAAIREAERTNRKHLEREIAKNPIYNDCRVPSDGVRLYNAAIGAR